MNKNRSNRRVRSVQAICLALLLLFSGLELSGVVVHANPQQGFGLPPPSLVVEVTDSTDQPITVIQPGVVTVAKVTVLEEHDGSLVPKPNAMVITTGMWAACDEGITGPSGALAGRTGADGTLLIGMYPPGPGVTRVSAAVVPDQAPPTGMPPILAWGQTKVFALGDQDSYGILRITPSGAESIDPLVGFVPPGMVVARVEIDDMPMLSAQGSDMALSMLVPAKQSGIRETGVLRVVSPVGEGSLFVVKEIELPVAGEILDIDVDVSGLGRLDIALDESLGATYKVWARPGDHLPWQEMLDSTRFDDNTVSFCLPADQSWQLLCLATGEGTHESPHAWWEESISFSQGPVSQIELSQQPADSDLVEIRFPTYTDRPGFVLLGYGEQELELPVEDDPVFLRFASTDETPLVFLGAEREPYSFLPSDSDGEPIEFVEGQAILSLEQETDGLALQPVQNLVDPQPFVGLDGDVLGYFPGCVIELLRPTLFTLGNGRMVKIEPSQEFPLGWAVGVKKLTDTGWEDETPSELGDIQGDRAHWWAPHISEEETTATYQLDFKIDLGPLHGGLLSVHTEEIQVGKPQQAGAQSAAAILDVIPNDGGGPLVGGEPVTIRLWAHWVPGSPQDGLSGVDFTWTYPRDFASAVQGSLSPVFVDEQGQEHVFFPGHWLGDVCEIDPLTGEHILVDGEHSYAFDRGIPVFPEIQRTDKYGNADPEGSYETLRYVRYLLGDEPCSHASGMLLEWQMVFFGPGEVSLTPVPAEEIGEMVLDMGGFDLRYPDDDPFRIHHYGATKQFTVVPKLGPVEISAVGLPIARGRETVVSGTGNPGVPLELIVERSEPPVERIHVTVGSDGNWWATIMWPSDEPETAEVVAVQRAYGQEVMSAPAVARWEPYVPYLMNVGTQQGPDGTTRIGGHLLQNDPEGSRPQDIADFWAIWDPSPGTFDMIELDALVQSGEAAYVVPSANGDFTVFAPEGCQEVLFIVNNVPGNQSSYLETLYGAHVEPPQPPVGEIWTGVSAQYFDGGTGTAQDPYLISTPEQLALLAGVVNQYSYEPGGATPYGGGTRKVTSSQVPQTYEYLQSAHYKLTGDIVLNDIAGYSDWGTNPPENRWVPIGSSAYPFKGHFDGSGHTVGGLYFYMEALDDTEWDGFHGAQSIGLFSNLDHADIRNVSLYGGYLWGSFRVGAVAGHASLSSIYECQNTGVNVSADRDAGGIVGYNAGSTVSQCVCAPGLVDLATADIGQASPFFGHVIGRNLYPGATSSGGIALQPGDATVAPGGNQPFALPGVSPLDTVTWMVSGGTGSTGVTPAGVLSVDSQETSSTLYVTASVRSDQGVFRGFATASVTVGTVTAPDYLITVPGPEHQSAAPVDTKVALQFIRPVDVDPGRFTFILSSPQGPVQGLGQWMNETNTIYEWTPSQPLAFNTTYTVNVDAYDLAGNRLQVPMPPTFTTAPEGAPPAGEMQLIPDSAFSFTVQEGNDVYTLTQSRRVKEQEVTQAVTFTVKRNGEPAVGAVIQGVQEMQSWPVGPDGTVDVQASGSIYSVLVDSSAIGAFRFVEVEPGQAVILLKATDGDAEGFISGLWVGQGRSQLTYHGGDPYAYATVSPDVLNEPVIWGFFPEDGTSFLLCQPIQPGILQSYGANGSIYHIPIDVNSAVMLSHLRCAGFLEVMVPIAAKAGAIDPVLRAFNRISRV